MERKVMVAVALGLLVLGLAFLGNVSRGERNYCAPDSREVEACITVYDPVCGYFGDGSTQTFSNSCVACQNEDVESWTKGECAGSK